MRHPVADPSTLSTDNPFGAEWQGYTDLGYLGHPGVDYAVPVGTEVYACDQGIVVTVRNAGTAGNMVAVRHTHGLTRYLHLSVFACNEGDYVVAGQLIGYSGNTGLSEGPHLHLDYFKHEEPADNGYGGRVDPTLYMDDTPRTLTGAGESERTMRTPEQQFIIDVLMVNMEQRIEEAKAEVGAALAKLDTLDAEVTEMAERLETEWPK